LTQFHNERLKQVSLILESEQWNQADVPVDFQAIAQQIMDYGHLPETDKADQLLEANAMQETFNSLDELRKSALQVHRKAACYSQRKVLCSGVNAHVLKTIVRVCAVYDPHSCDGHGFATQAERIA